jgi:hypothetical protein
LTERPVFASSFDSNRAVLREAACSAYRLRSITNLLTEEVADRNVRRHVDHTSSLTVSVNLFSGVGVVFAVDDDLIAEPKESAHDDELVRHVVRDAVSGCVPAHAGKL